MDEHPPPTGRPCIRGAVTALRSCGHQRVLLDLTGLRSADDSGLRRPASLRDAVEADGGRLTVLPAIDEPSHHDRRSA